MRHRGKQDVVLVVGRVPYGGPAALCDWHLARAWERTGAQVVYVDPPRPAHHALVAGEDRGGLRTGIAVHGATTVVSPVVPPLANDRMGARIADRVISEQIRRAIGDDRMRQVGMSVVFDPRRSGLGGRLPRPTVLWRMDRFGSAEYSSLVQLERRAIGTFDLVSCVSAEVAVEVEEGARAVAIVPNGCDYDHFASAPAPPDTEPRLVMMGGLGWRIDTALLAEVVRRRPSWTLDLVGPVERSDLPTGANVVLRGHVDFDELPAVVGRSHVGLIPYNDDEFNRASFPLKAFEYLAAGRPVVSTPIDPLRSREPHVRVTKGSDAFIAGIDEALATGPDLASCRAVGRANSWERRAAELWTAVEAGG